ncbi:3'(2'),5'-bisphosphate nucleotidase CysQ [Gemmobacter sp. LW-1]|uniref:3'(2'),5'-bisphosphate nucleotidase CysQ n=1 Tax=Gemmobacter sp. LW-1 TaxID=1529005 RepID=UPI000B33661D|nr:3'(2'),5'-bisphosphate nucleotidase CysQ [Gemmobacter sp. LW-1]
MRVNEDDLVLITDAARQAGALAMRYWRQAPKSWEKPGQGPVSEADLAVNALLHDLLLKTRPGYGWLSEEDADTPERLAAARLFVLDPIDGTRAFIAGEDTFAVSLAVVEQGIPVAGVVHLPALDRTYTAALAQGARKNDAPIRASGRAGVEGATLLTTGPNMAPEHWPGGVPDLKRSFRPSLAYRLCLVAEGRHDGMLTLRDAWEWDIAAGALIAAEAGATVTDRLGQPLRFNIAHPQAAGVIAAAPGLHAALLSRLGHG